MAGLHFSAGAAAIAVTSTPKSVLGVQAPANQRVVLEGFFAGLDGVTSTVGPALIEVCTCTFATNVPGGGGNSTAITPVLIEPSLPETIQSIAAKAWTTEPTVVTAVDYFPLPTYMGTGLIFFPLKKAIVLAGGKGCVLRVTLPSGETGNFTGSLRCEE